MHQSFDCEKPVSNPAFYLRYSGLNIRIWINGKVVYSGNYPPNDCITIPLPKGRIERQPERDCCGVRECRPNRYIDVGLIDPGTASVPTPERSR